MIAVSLGVAALVLRAFAAPSESGGVRVWGDRPWCVAGSWSEEVYVAPERALGPEDLAAGRSRARSWMVERAPAGAGDTWLRARGQLCLDVARAIEEVGSDDPSAEDPGEYYRCAAASFEAVVRLHPAGDPLVRQDYWDLVGARRGALRDGVGEEPAATLQYTRLYPLTPEAALASLWLAESELRAAPCSDDRETILRRAAAADFWLQRAISAPWPEVRRAAAERRAAVLAARGETLAAVEQVAALLVDADPKRREDEMALVAAFVREAQRSRALTEVWPFLEEMEARLGRPNLAGALLRRLASRYAGETRPSECCEPEVPPALVDYVDPFVGTPVPFATLEIYGAVRTDSVLFGLAPQFQVMSEPIEARALLDILTAERPLDPELPAALVTRVRLELGEPTPGPLEAALAALQTSCAPDGSWMRANADVWRGSELEGETARRLRGLVADTVRGLPACFGAGGERDECAPLMSPVERQLDQAIGLAAAYDACFGEDPDVAHVTAWAQIHRGNPAAAAVALDSARASDPARTVPIRLDVENRLFDQALRDAGPSAAPTGSTWGAADDALVAAAGRLAADFPTYPDTAEALGKVGLHLAGHGWCDEGEAKIESALAIAPDAFLDASLALFAVADCHERHAAFGKAIAVRERLAERYPLGKAAGPNFAELADAREAIGDFRAAAAAHEAFGMANAKDPAAPRRLLRAAEIAGALGEWEAAERRLMAAERRGASRASSVETRLALTRAAVAIGRVDLARGFAVGARSLARKEDRWMAEMANAEVAVAAGSDVEASLARVVRELSAVLHASGRLPSAAADGLARLQYGVLRARVAAWRCESPTGRTSDDIQLAFSPCAASWAVINQEIVAAALGVAGQSPSPAHGPEILALAVPHVEHFAAALRAMPEPSDLADDPLALYRATLQARQWRLAAEATARREALAVYQCNFPGSIVKGWTDPVEEVARARFTPLDPTVLLALPPAVPASDPAALTEALARDGTDRSARLDLARAYYAAGQATFGRWTLELAPGGTTRPGELSDAALVAWRGGDTAWAIETWTTALAAEGDDAPVRRTLAALAASAGDSCAVRNLLGGEGGTETSIALAFAEAADGLTEDAIARIEALPTGDPAAAEASGVLAFAHLSGDLDAADRAASQTSNPSAWEPVVANARARRERDTVLRGWLQEASQQRLLPCPAWPAYEAEYEAGLSGVTVAWDDLAARMGACRAAAESGAQGGR